VFQVDDRVKVRPYAKDIGWGIRDPDPSGTVIEINGRWITVRHDKGSKAGGPMRATPPRFDYLAEDLEHLNPLLKLARALGPNDRPVS
jgi:hypothetical protein